MKLLTKESKKLALLIDPEKYEETHYFGDQNQLDKLFNVILVGGSSDELNQIDSCIENIKKNSNLPIYIFPGSHEQISNKADGMLYISLISGDNPNYLIGEHKKSARKIKKMGIDIVPTGYILIDGANESAVERVSKTKPMSQENPEAILDTALAGELLGMKAVYLEAGSGAKKVVNTEIVKTIAEETDIPIIVGGGIRKREEINSAFENGANMVVIGTFIEENTENLDQLKS